MVQKAGSPSVVEVVEVVDVVVVVGPALVGTGGISVDHCGDPRRVAVVEEAEPKVAFTVLPPPSLNAKYANKFCMDLGSTLCAKSAISEAASALDQKLRPVMVPLAHSLFETLEKTFTSSVNWTFDSKYKCIHFPLDRLD